MRKVIKRLLAAVLACGMTGCGGEAEQTDTVQTVSETVQTESTETTSEIISETAAADAELSVETLAEGEKRDWSVEDVLKNDLEIDGIPISIPCTLNELLETLGEDYSVDEDEIKDNIDGEASTKSKYFSGEIILIDLYRGGENTYSSLHAIATTGKPDFENIHIIGFFNSANGVDFSIGDLAAGDSVDEFLKKYGKPNDITGYSNTTFLHYADNDGYWTVYIKNDNKDIIDKISMLSFKTEELETVQTESTETTSEIISETAAADAELFVETLAEGEKRDWSVEDVLKNDLEIDGIPVSIPCTLNELLEALGEDYSVDKDEIKDNIDGEFLSLSLYYRNENTYGLLMGTVNPENVNFDNINIDAYLSGGHDGNGSINLSELSIGDSLEKCLEIYGKPNKVKVDEKTTYLTYKDNGSFIQINVKDNIIDSISMIGFETEDMEDESKNK